MNLPPNKGAKHTIVNSSSKSKLRGEETMPNASENQEDSKIKLARLMSRQLAIIEKIEELAKLMEKLSIAKQELKVLVRSNHDELHATLKDIEKE